MENLVDFFNSGAVYENTEHVTYLATKLSNIQERIIPFFEKYPLQGHKHSDFKNFCLVAKLMEKKVHLTPEGLDQIIEIKQNKIVK